MKPLKNFLVKKRDSKKNLFAPDQPANSSSPPLPPQSSSSLTSSNSSISTPQPKEPSERQQLQQSQGQSASPQLPVLNPPPSESPSNVGNKGQNGEEEDVLSEDCTIWARDGETKKIGKDDFELLMVIGKGGFGKVMQVRKKDDGKIFAMKVLKKKAVIARKQVAHTKAERAILQKIHHPFIVSMYYAFQTEGKLYMILDYVNGGELFFHLKKEGKFSEKRVRFYSAEIALALGALHEAEVVYRDLKPENILLDASGHLRITDFGLSKEINPEEGTNTFCGTREYLAPEVIKGNHKHGTAVDWWSLGTLMFEMLTGLPPFYSTNTNIMYQKILTAELILPSFLSNECKSVIAGLLERDPTKRLGSTNDVEDLKVHPFFKSIDWEKLFRKEIAPPFKPKVKGVSDYSQIDPYFTQEKPVDSPASLIDSNLKQAADQKDGTDFEGFTYVNPESHINK